ncbi:MAG: hypothetical protein RBR26_06715 [Methanosarcina mazei]|jgi:hypothetical protein|nr:hypothetical protein [Methanosarcina mazei]
MAINGYESGIIVFDNHVMSALKLDDFIELNPDECVFTFSNDITGGSSSLYYGCETTPGPPLPVGYVDSELLEESWNLYLP